MIDKSINEILEDYGNLKNEFGKVCGTEYKDARVYHSLDIDEDGDNDILVFFTLEGLGCGASDYSSYLLTALYDNDTFSYKSYYKIGGKGILTTDFNYLKYDSGKLLLKATEYADDGSDPLCCPSKTTNFNIYVNDLILIDLSLDGYYRSNGYALEISDTKDDKFNFSILGVSMGDICEIDGSAELITNKTAIFDDKKSANLWKVENCIYKFDIFKNLINISVSSPRCEMTYCGYSAYISRKYKKYIIGDYLAKKKEEKSKNKDSIPRWEAADRKIKDERIKNNYIILTNWDFSMDDIIEYKIEDDKIIYKYNSSDGAIIESSIDCDSVKEIKKGNEIIPFKCN